MIDLVGHTLNKVVFNEDEGLLSLTVDDEKVFLISVKGGCCSTGKFIGVTNRWRVDLPSRIVSLEEWNEEFSIGGSLYQVYEDTYLLENGQNFKIVYDNYSNGYYGSSLDAYYKGDKIREFPKDKVKP